MLSASYVFDVNLPRYVYLLSSANKYKPSAMVAAEAGTVMAKSNMLITIIISALLFIINLPFLLVFLVSYTRIVDKTSPPFCSLILLLSPLGLNIPFFSTLSYLYVNI